MMTNEVGKAFDRMTAYVSSNLGTTDHFVTWSTRGR